jgi:predicted ATPase
MLTRFHVSGFKNLVDVDVSFGPFTCIAGGNGVGKSNLFDAISFLASLADMPLLDAALAVRSEGGQASEVSPIFHHIGTSYGEKLSFEAEMLVPQKGTDDLGQEARASITFLKYSLTIARREQSLRPPRLEICHEELVHVKLNDAQAHLAFPHKAAWRRSVANGRRTSPFISTENNQIKLHGDTGTGGRPRLFQAATLPRTVLSSTSASESPTALLARREMQSWRVLQLEPSAMRAPDPFNARERVNTHGAHLPATLARLSRVDVSGSNGKPSRVYMGVANRLAELVEGIKSIRVDRDDKRELLSLIVTDRAGTDHEARALSDGTLRFLALAVLEADPGTLGLLCLEEPENGIHPERVKAMINLLQALAVDPNEAAGEQNPLRQVIINTHSPSVVSLIPDDALLYAGLERTATQGTVSRSAVLRWLPKTWRARARPDVRTMAKGDLLAYLNPTGVSDEDRRTKPRPKGSPIPVAQRPDLQRLLPFPAAV